jgi:transcriptional regulator with XRE-family HTH domain
MTADSTRDAQLHALGAFIRAQRQLANLSLRQLADLTHVSNPYLSQLERGLHEPSVRVLQSISRALDVSTETLLRQVGMVGDDPEDDATPDTEGAIRQDPVLSDAQKQALLAVYRSYVQANVGRPPHTDTREADAPAVP